MIKKIKVKNQIEDLEENVNLNDANLAKEEGPNGEKVEANPYFTLMYLEDNVKYIDSNDNAFNPSKTYFIKEGSSRVKEAKPIDLGLYEYNGLTYVPTRDKYFKDREYFLNEEGTDVATPDKCNLKEKDPSSKPYPKYTLNYKPNAYTAQKQLANFSGYESWDTAKALYEACVNNEQEINDIYNENENFQDVKDYIKNNFKDLSKKYKENILLKQQRIGAENSLNLTHNKRSMIYNSANYRAEIEKQILAETGKTIDQYIKEVNSDRISKEDINKLQKIGGRRIRYDHNKYKVSTPKVDGIYIIRKDNGAFRYEVAFNTLEEALDGIVVLNTVAANLASNIKGKKFEEAEALYEEASNELNEQFNNTTTEDSCSYITYKVKDNKKIITGYYNTYEDALLSDDDEKLVKKTNGVYFNEATGKYLAIPQPKYAEGATPNDVHKIVRLGEFNSELDAIKAIQVLAKLGYNFEAFFESKFYSNHLDECQEARDYYFKENLKTGEGEVGIVESNGVYKIWVTNPRTGEIIYLDEDFQDKKQADALVKQAVNSPDTPYDFFYKFIRTKQKLEMETEQDLDEFQVEGIRQKALTHEDVKRLIENINVDDLDPMQVKNILSGSFGARAGGLYIFKNVIDYLRNQLNLKEEDIDYNTVLILQNKLVNKYMQNLFEEIKNGDVVATNARDIENVEYFIRRMVNDELGAFANRIISPKGLNRFAKELLEILKNLDKE